MKEHPILFSGPMVRAILDGCKTQTRRVLRREKLYNGYAFDDPRIARACPYGQPGDWLWVRETWHSDTQDLTYARAQHEDMVSASPIFYRADDHPRAAGFVWRPSIFMPRWASRITLEIVGVRVERVQDISEADAWAEGMNPLSDRWMHSGVSARKLFRSLWNDINTKRGYSWDSNPWVWVVEFRRLEAR